MEGTLLLIGFIALCFALVAIFVVRPKLTTSRGGKIMAFLVFFLLPVLAFSAGFSAKLQGAKNTSFCLSCHIMEPYGKSLLVDDPMHGQTWLTRRQFEAAYATFDDMAVVVR